MDELLAKITTSGAVYYAQDALDNVVRLTDNAGTVLEKYSYDIDGKPTVKDAAGTVIAGSAYTNRFMFTGREYLQEIGLYDYRHRIYSAELGRFLQTDPIGFEAGDVNLYRYVGNNPINYTDPLGLIRRKLTMSHKTSSSKCG